jgi:mRNA interferase MazF
MFLEPRRGEIWLVDFSPQVGAELRSPHPAVVVSSDNISPLPLRIVVPIRTARSARYDLHPWLVQLQPTPTNGLTKICHADAFQTKSLSFERFRKQMGILSDTDLQEVLNAVVMCLDI